MRDQRSPAAVARVQRRRDALAACVTARLASGAQLPTSAVLARVLGVSRVTAWKERKLAMEAKSGDATQETPDAR